MGKLSVIGWVYAYDNPYPKVSFTEERKRTLIERIKKRQYQFTYFDLEYLGCCPYYSDNVISIPTKKQFDAVMAEAWKDEPLGDRLLPHDVIELKPIKGVLYEKQKFVDKENPNG